uniref:WD repeat domain phosphoinositide-interacting protein 3 n=1 Tax=Wuchereria bancrofti TaxID=6293 RepID=A0A1I8EC49_WUCBA
MERASHVLFNTFNQDFGCFVCGLDDGFRIYNTDPLKQNFNEKLNGGIGAVEMLFRCNYVALVGGGVTPAFSTNKVVIWDIINHKEVVQLEMNSDVRAVRLRRDRIVVVLDTSVHIFSFTDQPEKLQVYDSSRNPRGICCLCPASENSLLAFPAPSSSSAVCCLTLAEPDAPPRIINAHQRPLSAIALNLTGEQLATSSEKGTIIRIFDTKTCLLLKELRRGTNPASIFWYLNFIPNFHLET